MPFYFKQTTYKIKRDFSLNYYDNPIGYSRYENELFV